MKETYSDKVFNQPDIKKISFQQSEFENCTFNYCDLSNRDFTNTIFIECTFTDCNLSLVKLTNTTFRDVQFTGCKMLGLMFNDCSKFGISFKFNSCTLNHSSFYQTKINKIIFENCQLHEADFTSSNATGALFKDCDLLNAKFENTILEKADFRNAVNYSINPELNKIKQAKFSLAGITGLLHKYNIIIE
jgi:fluoroquinolone resistance protein